MPKSLQELIKQYDLDGDGNVTDEEMKRSTELLELELREEKAEAQKKMSWIAILSMVIFTGFLFTPVVSESRVSALGDLLGLFYLDKHLLLVFILVLKHTCQGII